MKLLVIGSGAREHALVWAAAKSRHIVFCAPGNAGTAGLARNLPIEPQDAAAVVGACRELAIDLVVIGPEGPLAAGLVDALHAARIPVFGPPRKSAMLEASKAQARAFSERHGVPCARTAHFAPGAGLAEFHRFLDAGRGSRLVLKKSGLASGKGVLESDDPAELRAFGEAVLAKDELLAEDYLVGRELSVFALCTEEGYRLFEPAADHKKALAGDRGQNTGGMGAVSPLPFADKALMASIEREIVLPSFEGMAKEGFSYRGVLFFGIMVTAEGPRLLEYNVRFGDPETQSLLPRLEGDLGEICGAIAAGRLPTVGFSPRLACGVVLAAPGYPVSHSRGLPVTIDETGSELSLGKPELAGSGLHGDTTPSALLFQAATGRDAEGGLRTGGGRCFTAVGLGADWRSAHDRAYALAATVHFEGAWYRPDIGEKIYGK
jgi:phosphoribosylamine--glycine ligase